MTIKIDIDKIKARLEKQQQDTRDPKKDIILKPTKAGTLNFRAVLYPHSEDPASMPIVERFYHNGIPGNWAPFYCPKENKNEPCHLCEFIWEMAKAFKGTPQNREWLQKLPVLTLFVAGKVRGREDEGPKFWRFRSAKRRPFVNHEKMYEWLTTESTALFMDPDVGFDLLLKYEALSPEQKKIFPRAELMLKKSGVELDRSSTKFGDDYEEFIKQVPDIDTIYKPKTTQESLEALQKWRERLSPTSDVTTNDASEGTAYKAPPATDSETEPDQPKEEVSLEEKMKELGL